jgi:hypothetical protein
MVMILVCFNHQQAYNFHKKQREYRHYTWGVYVWCLIDSVPVRTFCKFMVSTFVVFLGDRPPLWDSLWFMCCYHLPHLHHFRHHRCCCCWCFTFTCYSCCCSCSSSSHCWVCDIILFVSLLIFPFPTFPLCLLLSVITSQKLSFLFQFLCQNHD